MASIEFIAENEDERILEFESEGEIGIGTGVDLEGVDMGFSDVGMGEVAVSSFFSVAEDKKISRGHT